MSSIASESSRWGNRVALGGATLVASLGLVVLSIASPTPRAGATSPHQGEHTPEHAFLTATCATLTGSYQVTGHAILPNGQPLPFSAVYNIYPNGNVEGTSSSFFPNVHYTGGESCNSGVGGVGVSNVANAADHLSAGEIFGNANFTVDSQGTLHANGILVVLSHTGAVVSTVTATAVPLPILAIFPGSLPAHPGPVTYAVVVPSAPLLGETATGTVSVSDGQGGQCTNIPLSSSGFVDCTMTENAAPGCPYHIVADYSGDNNYAPAEASLVRAAGAATGGTAAVTLGCTITASDGASATAFGGSGLDTISGAEYGTNPAGNLQSGTNGSAHYYDVQLSPGNSFTSVVIHGCDNVTPQTIVKWWNGSSWQPVRSPASNMTSPYGQSYAAGCISMTINTASSPNLSQLIGTVFATTAGRAITSPAGATATKGVPFSEAVTTIGTPVPSIKVTGKLPGGLRLVDHHNGTATLTGTPKAGGTFLPTITATYGTGSSQQSVSQAATFNVFQTPTFAKRASATARVGTHLHVNLTVKAFPPPTITESGALPHGITVTSGNGKVVLSGVALPGTTGIYQLTLTASTGEGSPINKRFTLTVNSS